MSGRISPEALARLAAMARARLQTPEAAARRAAVIEEKHAWSEETKDSVRQWAADGIASREMARRLGVSYDTVKNRSRLYGIDLRGPAADRYAAARAVLRQNYQTEMGHDELLRLYRAAVGFNVTLDAMQTYARKMGLRRPVNMSRALGSATTAARRVAERQALALPVQAMLDEHVPLERISAELDVSTQRLQRMLAEGLVVRPAKPPKPAKQAKPRAPKPPKPAAAKALPKSWVRNPSAPAKPRAVFQTVDEWLQAGNAITRCPAAVLAPTTHKPSPEDAEALRAYYAAKNAQESGTWKQRAKKKMGRIFYGKPSA